MDAANYCRGVGMDTPRRNDRVSGVYLLAVEDRTAMKGITLLSYRALRGLKLEAPAQTSEF
jgi:hypothetical protein